MAKRVGKLLAPYGEVYYTIETETHIYTEMTEVGRSKNLAERTSKANQIYYQAIKKYGKDNVKVIFISIHANAYSNPGVSGYESFVWAHGGEAHELAKHIHAAAKDILGVGSSINDRGIKIGNFAVLRNTQMPAILIEHEFYTNPEAVKKLKDNKFRQQCADHIAEGLLNYIRSDI